MTAKQGIFRNSPSNDNYESCKVDACRSLIFKHLLIKLEGVCVINIALSIISPQNADIADKDICIQFTKVMPDPALVASVWLQSDH